MQTAVLTEPAWGQDVSRAVRVRGCQQLVPRELLGRISSLDWLMSVGLVPVSYALTGPVSGALGPETTLVLAGVLGAVFMFALLYVPGVRDPERDDVSTEVRVSTT